MFKQIAIALIFIMSGTTLFAQKYKGYSKSLVKFYTRDLDRNLELTEANRLSSDDLRKIKGSPYENKLFVPGNLYKGDSLIATNIPMRYNVFSDQIELKDPKSTGKEPTSALLKTSDVSIKIYDNTYQYRKDFVSEKGLSGAYFDVVWEGDKYSLYKKTKATYHSPYKATNSFENDRPAEFTKNETFYLVTNEGEFTELPTRRSSIYKVLGDKKKEVKKYIKKNRLDIDEERDLARLVAFYNSLL